MSSHHDWVSEVVARHNFERTFAPENGEPLAFCIGDPVIYTNEYGLEFPLTVKGYYKPNMPCAQYALGCRYLLDSNSPWMPVTGASLRLDRTR